MGEGHGGDRKPQHRPVLHRLAEAEAAADDKGQAPPRAGMTEGRDYLLTVAARSRATEPILF